MQMQINRKRLEESMAALGRIGETPAGGLSRLALTDEDRRGRDLLVEWMRAAGLTVTIDRMGNIFGVVLAATLLTVLNEFLRSFEQYRMIVFSLLLILMMILRPQGLLGGLRWPFKGKLAKKTKA